MYNLRKYAIASRPCLYFILIYLLYELTFHHIQEHNNNNLYVTSIILCYHRWRNSEKRSYRFFLNRNSFGLTSIFLTCSFSWVRFSIWVFRSRENNQKLRATNNLLNACIFTSNSLLDIENMYLDFVYIVLYITVEIKSR